jgi:hypothetical protein
MAEAAIPRPLRQHPTPEQLYRARRGPRTAEAERWLAHAHACARCSEELLRQEAFDDPEPLSGRHLAAAWERFGERAPKAPVIPISRIAAIPAITDPADASKPQRRDRRPALRPAALALAAMLAAAVGLGLWTAGRAPAAPRSAVLRGGTKGGAPGAWQPSGTLAAPPTALVFPPDGEPHRVTVFDGSRSYTWTSPPASDGKVPFPAVEQQRLRRGVEYFWTVVDGDGTAARSFRLR